MHTVAALLQPQSVTACSYSGGSRILKGWFPLVVDHRRRGPPAAEEVLIFKSIQSIESYNVLYLRPLSLNYELATLEALHIQTLVSTAKCWNLLLLLYHYYYHHH